MKNYNSKYKNSLVDRCFEFSLSVILLCNSSPNKRSNWIIIDQLIRSSTSIGANLIEARASSKKDFKNKIFICKKESKETKYWLRMLARAAEELKEDCKILWQEAQEFTLIFSKIAVNTK